LAFPSTPAPFARALTERKYEDPTPVQLAVLEAKAEGRDLVVSAQTGSGKTVAYGLAIATTLLGEAERFPQEATPMALIVAPTRELAMQVERELEWLYHYTGARILSCVGGMDPKRERRRLADGAHIIVGTPGRLRDHLERGVLNITDPGQVSLEAGGVVTLPHHGTSQLFGVDVIAIAGNKAYVGYPTLSGAPDPETGETSLAVVDLTDYSVTTTMVFTYDVSIPTGVAALPLRLDLHQTVSDPTPLPGQLVTYTLTLANTGPQITGITLRDVLPSDVDFVGPITLFPPDAVVVGSTPPTLTTNLVISAYQHITVTFPVRVNEMPQGTVITNTAQADSPQLSTPATAQAVMTLYRVWLPIVRR
jgi:uncharacterized repeat protein (TIGR01451 family)